MGLARFVRLVTRTWLTGFTPLLSSLTLLLSFIPPVIRAPSVSDVTSAQQETPVSVVVVTALAALMFLVVLVFAIVNCNDCYNSEVSTDSHPASGGSGVKWGGVGGYSAAVSSDVGDNVLRAGFTGEVVNPGQGRNQPLPYAMIPTHVPEAQGFRGYEAPSGVGGYGSTGGWGSAPPPPAPSSGGWGGGRGVGAVHGASGNMPGAHTSPMMQQEPEEPPPAYRYAYR